MFDWLKNKFISKPALPQVTRTTDTPLKDTDAKLLALQEAINDVWGERYPIELLAVNKFSGPTGVVGFRELFPWKATTLRTIFDVDRMRWQARFLYETSPNAKGVIHGLRGYVIGKGLTFKVVEKDPDTDEDVELKEAVEPPQPNPAQVPGAKPEPVEKPKNPLVKKVTKVLEAFDEANDLCAWHREGFIRAYRDGELFIRIFPQDEAAIIRAIEPDQVRPPMGEGQEGPWAFGIKTSEDDWDTPLEYSLVYSKERYETVKANFIFHMKENVTRNVKRGISWLYTPSDELEGAQRLRTAAREGEKARQGISYIREHMAADKNTIETLTSSLSTGHITKTDIDGVSRDVQMQRQEPGTVVDIPKGLEYKPGPASGPSNHEAARVSEEQALLAVAACFNVSSFMVTGNGDASSYASAVVAESPQQQLVITTQEKHTKFWQNVYKAVIEIEIEKGNLPEDTLEQVDIHVTAPNPARDKKEAIEADLLLVDAGVMSDTTLAGRCNLDYDEEKAKGATRNDPIPTSVRVTENGQEGRQPATMGGKLGSEVPPAK